MYKSNFQYQGFKTRIGLYGKKDWVNRNRSLRQFFNFQKPFYTKKSNGLCEPSLNRLGLRTVNGSTV